MTAQVHDTVRFQRTDWSLVGIDGEGLFDPADHGINPVMLHTAAWRGFICHYEIERRRLRLARLTIGLDEETRQMAEAGKGPTIGAAKPRFDEKQHAWEYILARFDVRFTGRMLLGDGFVRQLYVHMGFQPVWKYERVTALVLTAGVVDHVADLSHHFAAVRDAAQRGSDRPRPGASRDEINEWIENSFDQSYGRSRVRRIPVPDDDARHDH